VLADAPVSAVSLVCLIRHGGHTDALLRGFIGATPGDLRPTLSPAQSSDPRPEPQLPGRKHVNDAAVSSRPLLATNTNSRRRSNG
jgi:hypothetical protein